MSLEGDGAVFRGRLQRDFKGARIGWLGDFGGATPYEPGVLETCRGALKAFEDMGCVVEEARPDYPVDAVWRAAILLRGWQQGGGVLAYYQDPARRALMKPEAVWEVETGMKASAYDVTAASTVRTEWYNAVRKLFARHDFLVMPTAQVFPFPVEERWPKAIAGQAMATYHEWMKATLLITMTGCPALAAPAGFGPNGLPIGIQIVGPNHAEMACLQIGRAYEQAAKVAAMRKPALA
jgi:amidase